MSKSVNQCLIIGNVGKEPETRVFDNGIRVATFSVATSTGGYKKQDGTEVLEKTQWHNIVAWRGLADVTEKYIHKGDKITVMGTISYREYENDKGEKKQLTDIIAHDLVLMGKLDNNSKSQMSTNAAPMGDFPPIQSADDLPF